MAKQRPITLCERDDDDDFIYQDENSIWFNAKKEPIAHGTELFERPKRDGPVGENPYKAIDNANGSPNTKKDGSINTRRNKGRKQKTNDFVSAVSETYREWNFHFFFKTKTKLIQNTFFLVILSCRIS